MDDRPPLRLVTDEERADDDRFVEQVVRTEAALGDLKEFVARLGWMLENKPEELPSWLVEYDRWCREVYARSHPTPAPWTVTFADGRIVVEGGTGSPEQMQRTVIPFEEKRGGLGCEDPYAEWDDYADERGW